MLSDAAGMIGVAPAGVTSALKRLPEKLVHASLGQRCTSRGRAGSATMVSHHARGGLERVAGPFSATRHSSRDVMYCISGGSAVRLFDDA
jgi:hypothetical protein